MYKILPYLTITLGNNLVGKEARLHTSSVTINLGVVKNTIIPSSNLNQKHFLINYHLNREEVVAPNC